MTLQANALDPPKEIQLWSLGENPTDYGVHKWTARSISEVLARYRERGNPILIDVEHLGAQLEDGEPAPTGGYARLEVRSGAPWLKFEWSDYAQKQITSGQRRFLSPEYDVDRETGEILALYRVSLVADPGTHRARMLATKKPKGRIRGAIVPLVKSGGRKMTRVMNSVPGEGQMNTGPNDGVPTSDELARMQLLAPLGDSKVPVDAAFERWLGLLPEEVASKVVDVLVAAAGSIPDSPDTQDLSEREMAKCKARGINPTKYAALKAASIRR